MEKNLKNPAFSKESVFFALEAENQSDFFSYWLFLLQDSGGAFRTGEFLLLQKR